MQIYRDLFSMFASPAYARNSAISFTIHKSSAIAFTAVVFLRGTILMRIYNFMWIVEITRWDRAIITRSLAENHN